MKRCFVSTSTERYTLKLKPNPDKGEIQLEIGERSFTKVNIGLNDFINQICVWLEFKYFIEEKKFKKFFK